MKIIEKKDSGDLETTYKFDKQIGLHVSDNFRYSSYKEIAVAWFKDIFLPKGYPNSVSSDYLQYQIWDSFQAYFSNLTGALSLHSIIIGIGVGKETASPLAASLSWLLKDGAGMVSSITFAYWKGFDLDNNSKQWRLFADVANDASHFLKLFAPFLPIPFVITLCLSSVVSSLVGVAGGCTRTSLIQHQALCSNMADVSAKDGSQETLVNLAGLITSLTLLPYITSNFIITWITFILCVYLHLYCNFRAMRALNMKTLNRARLLTILQHWVIAGNIPDVKSVNRDEPLLKGPAFQSDYLISDIRLDLGVSLKCLLKGKTKEELINIDSSKWYEKYKIFVRNKKRILILYNKDCKPLDMLISFWSAYLLALNLIKEKNHMFLPEFIIEGSHNCDQVNCDVIEETNCKANQLFHKFYAALLEKGWVLEPLRLNVGEWRFYVPDKQN